jgi:endoglucanase
MKLKIKYTYFTMVTNLIILFLTNFIICKEQFFNSQRKGVNIFNKYKLPSREDIREAKQKYHVEYFRLAMDKFESKNNKVKDFLIGNVDENYEYLVEEDLKVLIDFLDLCESEGMYVVLTMLSLPGTRYRGNNPAARYDARIFVDIDYQLYASKFLCDLILKIGNHKALVAIDILNEPKPEMLFNVIFNNPNFNIKAYEKLVEKILYKFYTLIINNIRKVNKNIFIIINSSNSGKPEKFKHLKPIINDDKIIYSFHMYKPEDYTTDHERNNNITYGGVVVHNNKEEKFNIDYLEKSMENVIEFQNKYNIKSNRIMVGEFGGNRFKEGILNYLKDLIKIFNKYGWHFSIYSFREDCWDNMDYELDNKLLPAIYWSDSISYEEKQIILKNIRNNNINNFLYILYSKEN